jgi:hypothetical protein
VGALQIRVLSDVNQLVFDDAAKGLKDHPATSEEIVACCDDLKLLGKLDFKNLLKWRTAVLRDSRFAKPKVGFVSVFSVVLSPSHSLPLSFMMVRCDVLPCRLRVTAMMRRTRHRLPPPSPLAPRRR